MKFPMTMNCDNQVAIHVASNHVFHERNQAEKVDCHLVREIVQSGV